MIIVIDSSFALGCQQSEQLVEKPIKRNNHWHMFGDSRKPEIEHCTALMADTVTGAHNSEILNFFATPLFSTREDLAYLHGSRVIQSMQLGPYGRRQLVRRFKLELEIRRLSALDADIQAAQFGVYYWTMITCLTNCAKRQRARKKVTRFRQTADRLRHQVGQPISSS